MIRWRNGKGGFVGSLKYLIKGVFSPIFGASSIGIFGNGLGVAASMDNDGIARSGPMNNDGLGIAGSMDNNGIGRAGGIL